jgi:uncharacterized protein YbjT (DUF2867 family)
MYVVAGVSGHTGSIVASTLLAEGRDTRVYARDERVADVWRECGAEVAIGSLDDAYALARAFRGAQGAYLLLPPSLVSRGDNAHRTAGYVHAIESSGLPHVVFLSSWGAQHANGTGLITWLHDAEVALSSSPAHVTFVRAGYFMENIASSLYDLENGSYPTFYRPDLALPMVAARDIGATAARELLRPRGHRTVLELSGPREYSQSDVAAELTRMTGRAIHVRSQPIDTMVPVLESTGMSRAVAGLYRELTHATNMGHVAFEGSPNTTRLRGETDLRTVVGALLDDRRRSRQATGA